MPRDTFTHTARTSATIDEVWETLENPSTWESIGGVDRVFDPVVDAQGRLQGFKFDTVAAGRKYVGTATPAERVEGRVMAWNVENSEIRGTTRVELRAEGLATEITVRLDVASASLMSGMFFPVIANAIGSGLPRAVEEFAAGFEP